MTVFDYTDADRPEQLANDPLSVAINETLDRVSTAAVREPRGYLGASSAGAECLRRIQFDWLCPRPSTPSRRVFLSAGTPLNR
jgi:hypothetical protein